MADQPVLLSLQQPPSAPRSARLRRITDPISLTPRADDRMNHFYDGLYDLRPESHLSRFVKTLIGDAGIGILSKQYLHARASSVIATTHYANLDNFYGDVLGLKRLTFERTDPALYYTANTPEQWDEIDARDASYRNRIEAFSRAIALGGTPEGLVAISEALLGTECRLHESYVIIDEYGGENPGGNPVQIGTRTYGDIEDDVQTYAAMNRLSYADIEAGMGTVGRTSVNNRSEFTVQPMRAISAEEQYVLGRVLERFKPANTLLTIDPDGVALHDQTQLRGVAADSTHWEVITRVSPKPEVAGAYLKPTIDGNPTTDKTFDRTRPAFSGYQGEAWSYNGEITRVEAYTEIRKVEWKYLPDPDSQEQRVLGAPNPTTTEEIGRHGSYLCYQRVFYPSGPRDYKPSRILADQASILQGRVASDAIMTASPLPAKGK